MCCERMVKILLRLFNEIIKHNHFPSRWLDALNVMVEKEKVNMTNELKITQIIEADFQLLMKFFLGLRIADDYENDRIMSKHNYGSRRGFSTHSTLLGIFDLARKIEDSFAYTMSDLEACFNRQLPNIVGIVEELIGVIREAIMLINKV